MQRTILTYGVVAGAVIIGTMILTQSLVRGENKMQLSEWVGYLVMIVALTMIFVGIKRYRDRELGGVIRFKTAFLLGLGITVVASLIYVATWEINLALTDYAFIDEYTQSIIEKKESEGLSGPELQALREEMAQGKRQYANPLFRALVTFLEIFPLGLLIALISAALLRNSRFLPASG